LDTESFNKEAEYNSSPLLPLCMHYAGRSLLDCKSNNARYRSVYRSIVASPVMSPNSSLKGVGYVVTHDARVRRNPSLIYRLLARGGG
jgi:hypothetical protein